LLVADRVLVAACWPLSSAPPPASLAGRLTGLLAHAHAVPLPTGDALAALTLLLRSRFEDHAMVAVCALDILLPLLGRGERRYEREDDGEREDDDGAWRGAHEELQRLCSSESRWGGRGGSGGASFGAALRRRVLALAGALDDRLHQNGGRYR
jgi:hypothetical protein